MRRHALLLLSVFLVLGTAALRPVLAQQDRAEDEDRVVTLDFVRTVPHEHDKYLQFVQANWVQAREAALREGFVTGYEVLVRNMEGEADVEWNVMLVTEYRDDFAYDRREELFGAVFDEAAIPIRMIDAEGPSDLAEVVEQHVVAEYVFEKP